MQGPGHCPELGKPQVAPILKLLGSSSVIPGSLAACLQLAQDHLAAALAPVARTLIPAAQPLVQVPSSSRSAGAAA